MIQAGIEEFNQGRYWEAHECWERAWRAASDSKERAHLQGMIQAAAAFVLLGKGRAHAAARVARRSLHHLGHGRGLIAAPGLIPLLEAIAMDPEGAEVGAHLAAAGRLRAHVLARLPGG